MKQLLILTALLLSINFCSAQTSDSSKAPVVVGEDVVFTKVEVEPKFPGENADWARYVQKGLGGFNPADNGAPKGKYKVIIRFIVSKEGAISDVVAETKYGYGMENISVNLIVKGPKWIAGMQHGVNVNCYRRQPITFVVE